MLTAQLLLSSPSGKTLVDLPQANSIAATWQANRIGSINIRYPYTAELEKHLHRDNLIQLWVGPENRTKVPFYYFLRYWAPVIRARERYIDLRGPDLLELLRRRVVAHFANSPEAKMTDQGDDMLKEIFADAFANGTNPAPDYGTRVISSLSSEGLLTAGPSVTKAFSFDELLNRSGSGVFPEIVDLVYRTDGTRLYYEIKPAAIGTDVKFLFRTATGQPRKDISDRFSLDEHSSCLTESSIVHDYQQEQNYIYGGGKGQQEEREVVQVYSAAAIAASDYNRCEGFEDRTQLEGDALESAANERLNEGLGTVTLVGSMVSTEYEMFGRDWFFGDRVGLRIGQYNARAVISSGVIKIGRGGVSVTAKLAGETND